MTSTKALAPFQIKRVREDLRTFEGLASTWDLDLGGDVIHKGAFNETLRFWRKTRRIVPLIDQHNYSTVRAVLGKMTDAKETDNGLLARFQVVSGDDGDALLARVRGGMIDGLSIGYEAISPKMENGIRHLREVKLIEVSVVIWGMNPNALIEAASMKALKDLVGHLSPAQKAELLAVGPRAAVPVAAPPGHDPQRSTVPVDADAELRAIQLWAIDRGITL